MKISHISLFGLIIAFLLPAISMSQHLCAYVSTSNEFNVYEIVGKISNSDDEVSHIVDRIVAKYGGSPNFILQRIEGEQNCYAWRNPQGLRYIFYDRDWMLYEANKNNTNYWTVIFIIAHEIGHHINGHFRIALGEMDKRNQELEADKFAGFMFKKLGGTDELLSRVLDFTGFDMFSYSSTHPAKIDRISAAFDGFNNADVEAKIERTENIEEIGNALIMRLEQLAHNVEHNTTLAAKINRKNFDIVPEHTIKGDTYKFINSFAHPMRPYLQWASDTYLSTDECFIFKQWYESLLGSNAEVFVSFDPKGESAFIFKTYVNKGKGSLNRQQRLFDVKKRMVNVSQDIFPESVYTNKEKTKFLYQIETGNEDLPFLNTFIDVEGYKKIYDCMPEAAKANYINPDQLLTFLKQLE